MHGTKCERQASRHSSAQVFTMSYYQATSSVAIYYVDSATGSGKTTAAFDYIAEQAKGGQNFCTVMPTRKLVKDAIKAAKARHPGLGHRIRAIMSVAGQREKVTERITRYLLNVDEGQGAIL